MKYETCRIPSTNQFLILDVTLIHNESLQIYFEAFANKEFKIHEAEGVTLYSVRNADHDAELKFLKAVRDIPIQEVPKKFNFITVMRSTKSKKMIMGLQK